MTQRPGQRTQNPFKPTAGKTPPQLIGRDDVIRDFVEGIENGPGAPGRLLRVTGMRGIGKTVVLNEFSAIAHEHGWAVVDESALPGVTQRITAAITAKSARGVDVSPQLSLGPLSLGVGNVRVGTPQSTSLREAMARKLDALEGDKGLLILLDEIQSAPLEELASLATAVQHQIRENRSIAFVFAGLPSAIDRFINEPSLTFLRRATPEVLTSLNARDVLASMRLTIENSGMSIGESTLGTLVEATAGYPFMVQLVGYHVWQQAFRRAGYQPSTVTREDAHEGILRAREAFDSDVIEPALSSLSVLAIRFLLAMSIDDGPSRTGEIAKRLGRSSASLGKYREALLRDSLISAPRRGLVTFSIPYLREYLRTNEERLHAILEE